MECPYSQLGNFHIGCNALQRISLTHLHAVGFVLLLVFSPSCVLSQDVNFTATTEMAEYTFIAGTTQIPQPTAGLTGSIDTTQKLAQQLVNRTIFELWFQIYIYQNNITIRNPHQECISRQALENQFLDFDVSDKGRLCPSYYDLIQCWPAAEPGIHIRPCPVELNGISYDTSDNVTRLCHLNGTWGLEGKSDYNSCEHLISMSKEAPHEFPILVITLAGYCISFAALIGAFFIFTYFKSLRCVRNYIHWNLVSSFILLYISFFIALVTNTQAQVIKYPTKYWVCRLLITLLHYCLMTNFFWMFVEGVYLYTLVARALTVRKDRFWVYIFLGWGLPSIFVSVFALLSKLYDDGCWLNEQSYIIYIISAPIIFIICINLIFLIHIMCILVTKLRASHSLETQQYRKAVKSTLVLLPLLGVSYLIFIFKPEANRNSPLFLVFQYLNALLHSTQGFFVAIIYVYMNQEVRNAIGRKIQRWREENTLPTKQISRRGSGQSRNNSLANVWNSARRGSQNSHSTEESATTLPFRLPSTDMPEYRLANGSRSPPFMRLDEIQPLNNTSPPSSASPTSKSPPPPPYSALFPVKEVDETGVDEQSEETEPGEVFEEALPLREGEDEVETQLDVAREIQKNHISVTTPDVICHTPLTNGSVDEKTEEHIVETTLDSSRSNGSSSYELAPSDLDTIVESGGSGNGDTKIISDKIDQNKNSSKQGPINNCLHEPVAVTVGGGDGQFNSNNCNNNNNACSISNSTRFLPKPPGVGKRVSFEDDDTLQASSSSSSPSSPPRQFCDTGFLTRGVAASALPPSEVAIQQQPIGATVAGQSIRHDDVTGSKHPNRVESVDKSKQKNCILSDVRQKNSGIVNGSIIFPKAPPGTPV